MTKPQPLNRALWMVPLLLLAMAGGLQASLLMEENFSYATGQLTDNTGGANVSGGNWVDFSGTGNFIPVASGSLSYPGYLSSGTGNKITVISSTGSSEDAYRAFTPQVVGSAVYASFLVNLANITGLAADTSSNGDYFVGLFSSTNNTYYYNEVTIKRSSTSGAFKLGLRACRATGAPNAVWASADFTPGTTYLLLLKYVPLVGDGNDSCYLWINPALTASEPAAQLVQTTTGTDPADIGRVAIRQGYSSGPPPIATPNADIDGIRVGTNWSDISGVSPFGPNVTSTSPANGSTGVLPAATISVTFDRLVTATTVDSASFVVAGKRQTFYRPDSIRPAANSATYTYYVRDSLKTFDTVTVTLTTDITDTSGTQLAYDYTWQFFTLVPDTVRPAVLSTNPPDGQGNVSVNTTVDIVFTEAVLPASVDTSKFMVTGKRVSCYLLKTPILSSGNTQVTIQPVDSFAYRDTVTVRVLPTITDLSGNTLRGDSISFSTRRKPGISIYDIQYTTDPAGTSPYVGQTVTFTGVITGIMRMGSSAGSYYVQDGSGPWNGIYCYDKNRYPSLGDSVRISGPVSEYYGETEISTNSYEVIKKGCRMPDPVVMRTDSLASGNTAGEAYEGVLVSTGKVKVTSLPNSYMEWGIKDSISSASATVDDFIDSLSHMGYTPVVGDSLISVRGIIQETFGYKIEPRFAKDIARYKPLRFLSSKPASGNANVPTQVGIKLEFDKPLDLSTATTASFSIAGSNSAAHAFTVTYDSSEYAIKLIPSTAFTPGETVTVWISHAISDTLGFLLDGNKNGTAANDSTDDVRFSFRVLSNATKIADVQHPGSDGFTPQLLGATVTVEGVVSGPDGVFTSSSSSTASWYLQDGTGGVNIYGGSKGTFDLGRRAVVTGIVTEYNGVTEIVSTSANIAAWDLAATLPQPKVMIYNQFPTEPIEGLLIQFDGLVSSPPSYAGGGYNLEVRNGDAAIAVRINDKPELGVFPLASMGYGARLRVIGIVSQYDKDYPYTSGYQIVPRFPDPYSFGGIIYLADITLLTDSVAPAFEPKFVSMAPNPFAPDWGEVATIELNAPATDHLTLRIYDLKGRLVKTCLNNVSGGHQYYYWDGTDARDRRATIGMYILHLRSVAPDGRTTDKTKLIVLGTPLK